MEFSKGYIVPKADQIEEEYTKGKEGLTINVSASHMEEFLYEALNFLKEPCYFRLELPCNATREEEINQPEAVHTDVYYIDGCTKDDIFYLLTKEGDLLMNDGMCRFGFGSLKNEDIIYVGKYNVVEVQAKEDKPYLELLRKLHIEPTSRLKTAYDTFSNDSPGMCKKYAENGKDCYSLVKEYEPWEIYLGETIED